MAGSGSTRDGHCAVHCPSGLRLTIVAQHSKSCFSPFYYSQATTLQTLETTRAELRQLGPLNTLDDMEIGQLAQVAKCRTLPAGTVLFAEGDEHSKIYLVTSGSLHLQMNRNQAGKQTLLSVGVGELLAWSAIVGPGTMTASAIAAEQSRVLELPVSELQQLFENDPRLGYHFLKIVARALSQRLLATRLQLLDLLR